MATSSTGSFVPDRLSIPCARFFAADWEAGSFLEFFADLQARVEDDPSPSAGRTSTRLREHARFALQMTLARSVDSFFAYLAEAERLTGGARTDSVWHRVDERLSVAARALDGAESIRNERSLAFGNVRQVDRYFCEATGVHVFVTPEDIEIAARLVVLRNFIAHGRTFAADDFARLVDDATSVGGIGLKYRDVRDDLAHLRAWVARTDAQLAEKWDIDRPVTSAQLFEAIARVAQRGESPALAELD